MKINEIVKFVRENIDNQNQKEFGDRFGKTKFSVSMYEAGTRRPPEDMVLYCIERMINTTMEETRLTCDSCNGTGFKVIYKQK